MKLIFLSLFAFICASFLKGQTYEAEQKYPTTRILFIFDASQSMFGRMEGQEKIRVAKRLLKQTLDSLEQIDNIQVALRAYGHTKAIKNGEQDCDDTRLEVPFGENNFEQLRYKLQTLQPKGTTPIALSIQKSEHDFPPCDNCRNVIILITDGLEACDGDPCAISRYLQTKGVIVKPFIIGVDVQEEFMDDFKCIGDFYDAKDATTFKKVLGIVVSEALNTTTCQVNLLDIEGNPTETNVNMTFMEESTGKARYNLVHTINRKGLPDTISVDPVPTYTVKVHTIPPVYGDGVKLEPGKHTVIPIDAPQGKVRFVSAEKSHFIYSVKGLIKDPETAEIITVIDYNKAQKLLVGQYDLELLTLPRIQHKNINIKQSEQLDIQVPVSGIASFQLRSGGIAGIYTLNENEEPTLIYTLDEESPNEKLHLLPGNYKIVFRPLNAKRTIYTTEKTFKVKSGKSVVVKI